MKQPQLGDSINGAEIGRSRLSTYYWAGCPDGSSPGCLGERWTTFIRSRRSRYAEDNPDWNKARVCRECYRISNHFNDRIAPRQSPTRAM